MSFSARPGIKAYILAADPAWIEQSVSSYYGIVDEIIVTYDKTSRGFTGVPIPVDECLQRLRAIDSENKMRFCPGDYSKPDERTPMGGEVYQRQCAFAEIGNDADWILQIDTDELLPNPDRLIDLLEYAGREEIPVVEWPMRVLFQRLSDGRFLEVCRTNGGDHFEYPGPIAARPGVNPLHGRRAHGTFLRTAVNGDNYSLQVRRPAEPDERRVEFCNTEDAILHFSWARTPEEMRLKVASWSHHDGLKSWMFYHLYWKGAPYLWRWMRDFHPFARGLWPALRARDYSALIAPRNLVPTL